MTDREMIELAAKAAGIECLRWNAMLAAYETSGGLWNPLKDDGDALRLAVVLRMEVDHNYLTDEDFWVLVRAQTGKSCITEEFDDENQRASATRRAIVRAAVQIGKAMP